MRELFALELAALAPILGGVYGNFGLFMRAHEGAPAALPPHLLGTVIDLALDGTGACAGRLRCTPAELPIASESCKLVIAQHVLECVPDPAACAAEFARVLAPEGIALVLGFNPVSLWRPWLVGKARQSALTLRPQSALSWQLSLANHGIETLQTRFLGAMSPWQRGAQANGAPGERRSLLGRVGGSWLLLTRKRRSALTLLRSRPAARELAINPRLAPGAHRQCA
ncbi:MAG: methyltransferase domain-containing protein [Rudaea sp.]